MVGCSNPHRALRVFTGAITSPREPEQGAVVWFGSASSARPVRTVQAADKHQHRATMGLHSMAGYAGGFLGPLGVGWFLDLAGGDSVLGWGLAFGHLALVTLAGLVVLRRLGRRFP